MPEYMVCDSCERVKDDEKCGSYKSGKKTGLICSKCLRDGSFTDLFGVA